MNMLGTQMLHAKTTHIHVDSTTHQLSNHQAARQMFKKCSEAGCHGDSITGRNTHTHHESCHFCFLIERYVGPSPFLPNNKATHISHRKKIESLALPIVIVYYFVLVFSSVEEDHRH